MTCSKAPIHGEQGADLEPMYEAHWRPHHGSRVTWGWSVSWGWSVTCCDPALPADREWVSSFPNFDNVGSALIILLITYVYRWHVLPSCRSPPALLCMLTPLLMCTKRGLGPQ